MPSVLTILGVIMFLRLPWVLGSVGLPATLLIVTLSVAITLLTGLLIAAMATNMRVGGGAYYMISRTLGSRGSRGGRTPAVPRSGTRHRLLYRRLRRDRRRILPNPFFKCRRSRHADGRSASSQWLSLGARSLLDGRRSRFFGLIVDRFACLQVLHRGEMQRRCHHPASPPPIAVNAALHFRMGVEADADKPCAGGRLREILWRLESSVNGASSSWPSHALPRQGGKSGCTAQGGHRCLGTESPQLLAPFSSGVPFWQASFRSVGCGGPRNSSLRLSANSSQQLRHVSAWVNFSARLSRYGRW